MFEQGGLSRRTPSVVSDHMANLANDNDDGDNEWAMITADEDIHTPSSLAEAKASPFWPIWWGGMGVEIGNLEKMETWVCAKLPEGWKAIDLKWV